MEREIRFEAQIKSFQRGGAGVIIPFSVKDVFGTNGRVPILATFDDEPYRGSIAPMGGGHFLGILKSIRAKIGKEPGDFVCVTLRKDESERNVELPTDFAEILDKNEQAKAVFNKMSYTNKKEIVRAIVEAKRQETRQKRISQTIDKLISQAK